MKKKLSYLLIVFMGLFLGLLIVRPQMASAASFDFEPDTISIAEDDIDKEFVYGSPVELHFNLTTLNTARLEYYYVYVYNPSGKEIHYKRGIFDRDNGCPYKSTYTYTADEVLPLGTYTVKIKTTYNRTLLSYNFHVVEKATEPDEKPSIPFTDVKKGTWQYSTAEFVYKRGILTGTSATTFSPNDKMTRGQLVTMLWRMEGSPSVPVKDTYSDVASGKYYETAIQWAKNKGLVNGYGNGKFGPDDPITRQQFVIILYRYAEYKGYSISTTGRRYTECSDYKQVSPSAVYCVEWGYENGLIGSGKVLNPQGNATRIEVSAIMQRFIIKYE